MTPRTPRLSVALASLCLAAAAVTGCIEEDPLGPAIGQVSLELESLAAPGTAIPGTKMRNDTYNRAISTLRPLVGEGTPAQKADAWLLIARSELGLAADQVAEAVDARSELAAAVAGIRAEVVAYRQMAARAAAAESFDPGDEIAELQGKISERVAATEQVRSEMEAVQKQIADLEALERDAREAAEEHRRAEASLRTEMMSLSAQEALPLATQAAEQRSRADDLSAEADRRAAEAAVLRPLISEFEGEIDRLAEQRRLLEESIASLNAQREATAAEAAGYRARADEIASRAIASIAEANAYRTGPLQQSHEAAVAGLEAAAESAAKATARRTGSGMLAAEILHTLGGTALAQADAIEGFGRVIAETIDDAGISGGGISSTLATVAADAQAARQAGEEALRRAVDRYQSAGVSGEGADRIDDVVASINAMLGTPETPEDDQPTEAGTTDESDE